MLNCRSKSARRLILEEGFKMRDIGDYTEKYRQTGFEQYKVLYRRKKILEMMEKWRPENVLEIGCGMDPLFQYVHNMEFTIVEPSRVFCDNVENLVQARDIYNVKCMHGFFEEVASDLSKEYDLVICSGLLHEVENPGRFIKSIVDICNSDTIVHINVPNASSLHRLLGKEMGILKDVHGMSKNNIDFQQSTVFDRYSLEKTVNENGLEIIESGGYFMKPFSHAQMYEMVQKRVINKEVLDGLFELGKRISEYGSEIYVNCKVK